MKNILFLFLIILIVQSCRKEDRFVPIGEYVTADLEAMDPPIMFTNRKMILDSGIINSYIRRAGSELFMKPGVTFEPSREKINFSFQSANQVIMKFSWKTIIADVMNNTSSQFTLKARDTTWAYLPDINEYINIKLFLNLFHPYVKGNVVMVPMGANGMGYAAYFMQEYQLERRGGQLFLPNLKIINLKLNGYINRYYFDYTRKNTDVSSYLGERDTVVIQFSRVALEKVE